MSWAGIDSNQCVSLNNLQDAVNNSVFTLKNAIPAGTKQITKAEAANYVNIDINYAPYSAKSSNQLVVKSNLQACTPLAYSYSVYYSYDDGPGFYAGYTTSNGACDATTPVVTVYSSSSTITAGAALYFDPCGYDAFTGCSYSGNYPYFKIGDNYVTFEEFSVEYTVTGNVIRSVGTCGPVYYTYTVRLSNNIGTICTDPSVTVYSSSVLLTDGDYIYYDTALTNPVTGYDYVVRVSGSPSIYNMNPGTGQLTSYTGTDC